jgi:putative addiction module killer protein
LKPKRSPNGSPRFATARAATGSRRGSSGSGTATWATSPRVGEGVSELRIHHGPGYRVYFVHRGKALVILLGGGDKASQSRDIAIAKKLAQTL